MSFDAFFLLLGDITIVALILCSCVLLSFVLIGGPKGAPFVRSSSALQNDVMTIARIRPGERVLDLGSGDGSLLILAAEYGAYGTGIEINPFLVMIARARIRQKGLCHRIRIIWGDIFNTPLPSTDLVIFYLWPETLMRLRTKLIQELSSHTRLVSLAFPIREWIPEQKLGNTFLYRLPSDQNVFQ
ncbi:MAG: methyltransferase type 11 [Parcubacteria group bacterium Gr01-1014_66]|nr:MAG: methyltransferase type 11 [Parcubacteria group bacterium Gr01-1014_66]